MNAVAPGVVYTPLLETTSSHVQEAVQALILTEEPQEKVERIASGTLARPAKASGPLVLMEARLKAACYRNTNLELP